MQRTHAYTPRRPDVGMLSPMARVLVVEDDPASRTVVARFLRRADHEVIEASSGREAIAVVDDADVVLLDVMMPELDGWDVHGIIRGKRPDLPIIFVTALADAEHELRGLRLGGDDYVTKPVDLDVLLARLDAVLKRHGIVGHRSFGALRIDLAGREVTAAGERIELTRTEFELLALLSGQPGRVFSRDQLLEHVWGTDFTGVDRVVDVRISTLRRKIGDDGREPNFIETVRGIGYRFLRNQAH